MDTTYAHDRALARTAYIFAFPLVLYYADLYAQAIDRLSPSYTGFGAWRHTYLPGQTLESVAWIDVRFEPWVRRTPRGEEVSKVGIRIADLWGHVAHDSTSQENGGAGESGVIIASPTWVGEIPGDIDHVVRGESSFLRVSIRSELHSSEQRPSAMKRHEGCVLRPLRLPSAHETSESPSSVDWLPWTAGDEITNRFWSVANFAMSLVVRHPDDEGVLNHIAEIGVIPGEPWDAAFRSVGMHQAVSAGMDDALTDLLGTARGPLYLEELGRNRQDYDLDYFGRALTALVEPSLFPVMLPGGEAVPSDVTPRRKIR